MNSTRGAGAYRIALVVDHVPLAQMVRELVATTMPSASVEALPLARAAASDADALILDETTEGHAGASGVQDVRARGYSGAVVLLAAACDAAVEHRLLALAPARCVARAEMVTALPAALAALAALPPHDEELAPIERELRRMQQLVAMGEGTSHIQHTLNNPLTALLAEAQLLEMEELAADHRAAVKRIIELCRRMVGMVRSLDPGPR